MDLTKLYEALTAEKVLFSQAVQAVLDATIIRRREFRLFVIEAMELNLNQEMSEDDFFCAIEAFEKISGNLDVILSQTEFNSKSCNAWVNKVTGPAVRSRSLIIQILLDEVIDYYAETRLANDLRGFLEEWIHTNGNELSNTVDRALLLSKDLSDIDVGNMNLSVRVLRSLRNDDIRTVGELVSRSRLDILRTPNLGRKSLNEIEAFLGRIGLSLYCMSAEENE